MPQWSNSVPEGQGYRETGGLCQATKPIPQNDILDRCRSLTAHDIRRIVALDAEGWRRSAEYVGQSSVYKGRPSEALRFLLPGMPAALREIAWRGSWLTEEEVASLSYEQLIAAAAQVIVITRQEKSLRELALAAAEELGLDDDLIGKLLGDK